MRYLFICLLFFIMSACGSDDSSSTTTNDGNNPTTETSINNKVFPYGTYQSVCHDFGIYTSIPAYNGRGVILQEVYNKENKTLTQHAFAYEDTTCTVPLFKISYYYSFNNIDYDTSKSLYKIKLSFIKLTATAGSDTVATNWNNSNYMGINTWVDRVETDITGRNADGSTFTPNPFRYKIISLTNSDTQLMQNEHSETYPETLDYGYVFFKRNY